jgi:hypothetical protein
MRLLFLFLLNCTSLIAQQVIVTPYIQPGNAPSLNKEEKVIIWQTDSIAATFKVDYGTKRNFSQSAVVKATPLQLGNSKTILYRAVLPDLLFDKQYNYRVTLNGKAVGQSLFSTRSTKPSSRFVVFGDCGIGTPAQAQVAYQAYLEKPDFVLITGDNVYQRGQVSEYLRNYFPYFNSATATSQTGAPLMRSTPFYLSIGNHDVGASNLTTYPDGLAYYYYFDLPLNAPAFPRTVKPIGTPERIAAFKRATAPRFPNMANYSFDYGNVHIVCLDANTYVHPFDPELVSWLETDLKNSNATWKLVAFHHPGFNSSNAHYNAQWMRALSPVFENSKVDMVLNGHVHNYQRSHPLKFEPKRDAKGNAVIDTLGRVDGKFTLDMKFDGKKNTRPDGIVYIVTGAGGAGLYDTAISNKPERWKHEPSTNWVPFTAKLISNIHSYTVIETKKKRLILRQFDVNRNLLDKIEMFRPQSTGTLKNPNPKRNISI